MAPPISTSTTPAEGARRRSLSGASALLARRFTRNSTAPRPTASKSESTARRRATIAAAAVDQTNDKVHVRIVPNIDNPSRSLIFDIVDRQLEVGSVIRIGRYSERHANLNCMSFKSKVVSRCHCEVWVETDGKIYVRDTKSSSGTFLNHVRLSPAGSESRPVELHDGDIVQLGVDFQGGREEMYRSVKMRFELNRSARPRPLSFNLNAFQNLRNLTQPTNTTTTTATTTSTATPSANDTSIDASTSHPPQSIPPAEQSIQQEDVDECCICLYALAPFQALFVSPCSHTYHFKCIRPLLQSYPGFQCPLCRTYSDLEASVAVEAEDLVTTTHTHQRSNTAPAADSGSSLQSPESSDIPHEESPLHVSDPYSTTLVSSPVIYSDIVPDTPCNDQNHSTDILHHVVEESTSTSTSSNSLHEQGDVTSPNSEGEDIHEEREGATSSSSSSSQSSPNSNSSNSSNSNTNTTTNNTIPRRERRSSHIMDKLKMVFFEKRKSIVPTNSQSKQNSRQRPLSYPNLISTDEPANSNTTQRQALSRQLTTTTAADAAAHSNNSNGNNRRPLVTMD